MKTSLHRMTLCLALGACSPAAAPMGVHDVVLGSRAEREALAQGAPEALKAADAELALAKAKSAQGDDVTAALHQERARARYTLAQITLRQSRARQAEAKETEALRTAEARVMDLQAERDRVTGQLAEAEKERAVREHGTPGAAGATPSKEREAARGLAKGAFLEEASALCDAASLVGPEPKDLLSKLQNTNLAIDEAIALRAKCLESLTLSRRAHAEGGEHPDKLYAELSAAGLYRVQRDERGVVVSLGMGDSHRAELVQVAKAHPSFAVQIVMPARTAEAAVGEWKQAFGSRAHVLRSGVGKSEIVFVSAL